MSLEAAFLEKMTKTDDLFENTYLSGPNRERLSGRAQRERLSGRARLSMWCYRPCNAPHGATRCLAAHLGAGEQVSVDRRAPSAIDTTCLPHAWNLTGISPHAHTQTLSNKILGLVGTAA